MAIDSEFRESNINKKSATKQQRIIKKTENESNVKPKATEPNVHQIGIKMKTICFVWWLMVSQHL